MTERPCAHAESHIRVLDYQEASPFRWWHPTVFTTTVALGATGALLIGIVALAREAFGRENLLAWLVSEEGLRATLQTPGAIWGVVAVVASILLLHEMTHLVIADRLQRWGVINTVVNESEAVQGACRFFTQDALRTILLCPQVLTLLSLVGVLVAPILVAAPFALVGWLSIVLGGMDLCVYTTYCEDPSATHILVDRDRIIAIIPNPDEEDDEAR